MDDRELELARLVFLKDGLVAEFQVFAAWWQSVLGASLGAAALLVIARAGGQSAESWFLPLLLAALAGGILALVELGLYVVSFEGRLGNLVRQIERLKARLRG